MMDRFLNPRATPFQTCNRIEKENQMTTYNYAEVNSHKMFYRAYVEGIGGAFDPMKPFWAKRNKETEKPVRALLTLETTTFQYTYGAKNAKQISPDNWTFDQIFLDRPGNDAVQLDLLHDYNSNLALYDGWHEYFRTNQPRTLILWGKNDPFFTVEGSKCISA
jgi:hypothetical protein